MLTVPTSLYRPVYLSSFNPASLLARVRTLTQRIARFEHNPKWSTGIAQFLGKPFVAHMGAKLKVQKTQGEIKPRSIHLAGTGSLHGLSSWLVSKTLPWLRSHAHIAKDSEAMTDSLLRLNPLPPGVVMGTFDIKDYYLTGIDTSLAKAVSRTANDPSLQSLLYDVTFSLLETQLVKPPGLNNLYACNTGSGIGLKHSSVIAGAGLLHGCELQLLMKHGDSLVGYSRFEDDITVTAKSMTALTTFGKDLCHGYPPYKVIASQISRSFVNILDLRVHLSHNNPIINPNFEKIPSPLCPTSAHAPHVHSSWPSGLASRAVRLSDNSEESLAKLIAQYSGIACDSIILERLQRPRGGPTKGGTNPCDDSVLACSQAPCATCVLKYHPLLRAAAAGALRQTPLPPSLGFNVRIAWRNALPSVESIISRHNTRHTGQEGGISVCESHGTHKSSLLALATN